MVTLHDHWNAVAKKLFEGKKIAHVRYLTDKEKEQLDWHNSCIVFFLEDGSYFFPSMDDEGNNAGALFTSDKDQQVLPII